jgi:hypothetical protein
MCIGLYWCKSLFLLEFVYPNTRPLGRPRLRWEDNIKMDLREIGFGDVDWIHWAQDRDRWRAIVNEPSGSIKCGEFLDQLSVLLAS